MKARVILKVVISILILIILLLVCVLTYYILVDIESKVPKGIEENCKIEVQDFMGRKVFVMTPEEETSDLNILYFHGGSYVSEASQNHWEFLNKLVNNTKATVIMPDYPLTPKYNYKDVFQMAVPLYTELIDNIEPENLIIMGDSAGGGISLALLEKIGEDELPQPKKTILISPWLDVRLTNPEVDEVQKLDKQLNKELLMLAGISYAGEDGMSNYLVNPIDGPLGKLGDLTIFTGAYDILNPDVYVLIDRAKEKNSDIKLKEYKEAGHIWFIDNNSGEKLTKNAYEDLLKEIQY